jgi:hypothetical protein
MRIQVMSILFINFVNNEVVTICSERVAQQ